VLQKQGLMLSPPSRQTTSLDEAQNQDKRLNEGECCYSKALSSNPKGKMTLSVDNLGLGRLPPLGF
jgi:hypothetical protein